MLGVDPRAARIAWTVFLIALLLAVVYFIRKVLFVFIIAVLFAYLLSPLVNLVDRFLPWRRSRPFALALVYILLIVGIAFLGVAVGKRVSREAAELDKNFPALQSKLEDALKKPGSTWLQPVKNYILEQIEERKELGAVIMDGVKKFGGHVLEVASSAVLIILIPILGFFFLKDGLELKQSILEAITTRHREMWEDIVADLHTLLGQFIRALVILAFATFLFYSIFFSIIGLPYAVLLACIAGALEFIPMFGPLTASVTIIAVAAITGTGHMVMILAFLAGYRVFQDYGLNPHLMSAGVALHPLLVIFGVLAGEEIAGVAGMFLSVPTLAALRVLYYRVRKEQVVPEAGVTVS